MWLCQYTTVRAEMLVVRIDKPWIRQVRVSASLDCRVVEHSLMRHRPEKRSRGCRDTRS